jgi:hypothetical protein
MALYSKPVRILMKDMANELAKSSTAVFAKQDAIAWFAQRYPKIKMGTVTAHLTRLSTNAKSRTHYRAKPGEDDVLYQVDGSHYRLYRPGQDPAPIYLGAATAEPSTLHEGEDEETPSGLRPSAPVSADVSHHDASRRAATIMPDRAPVLELLEEIRPRGYCDDCLSIELDIQPRQAVNQICRALFAAKSIERAKANCDRCGKEKIINVRNHRAAADVTPKRRVSSELSRSLDIEKTRTQVVQICRELWRRTQADSPSHSISATIIALKNKGALPTHQANMMLTLCGLRNVHVYEGLVLGPREILIASNARELVLDWWSKQQENPAFAAY